MNSAAEIKAQAADVTAAKSISNAAQGTAIDALAIAKAADSIGSATKTARSEGPSAITCIRLFATLRLAYVVHADRARWYGSAPLPPFWLRNGTALSPRAPEKRRSTGSRDG